MSKKYASSCGYLLYLFFGILAVVQYLFHFIVTLISKIINFSILRLNLTFSTKLNQD